MILFLAMCTFFIIILCCCVVDDTNDIHPDSRKGSFYEISNRKD